MNLFDLTGKVAIVTGGNGGIGLGIAQGLAEAGAGVVVLGRNTAKSESAARQLQESTGAKALVVTADVSREDDAARAVAETLAHFGRIDILFNNAGINIRKQPQDLPLEDWDQVLKVNLTSAFLMSKAVYPAMKQRGRRQDHQHRQHDVDLRSAVCRGLCLDQGRNRSVDQEPGAGLGRRQHSSERDFARLVRHRANRKGPGADPRPSRASAGEDRRGRWAKPADMAGTAIWLAGRGSDYITGRRHSRRRRLHRHACEKRSAIDARLASRSSRLQFSRVYSAYWRLSGTVWTRPNISISSR